MGKFNEYSQKATPADNDTMMIYDAAAKANKLSPFSGIWNWIVGKLTNAVISNLQTNNKTIIGALNELNSKPLTVTINNTSLEAYLANLGEDRYAMLYVLKNNDNPVIDGFRWEYFSIIVIKSRIIAFSPSSKPGVIATRQYINNKLGDWISIK